MELGRVLAYFIVSHCWMEGKRCANKLAKESLCQRKGARQKEMSHQQRERRLASEKRVDSRLMNSINQFKFHSSFRFHLCVRERSC